MNRTPLIIILVAFMAIIGTGLAYAGQVQMPPDEGIPAILVGIGSLVGILGTALGANVQRKYPLGDRTNYLVAASTTIYEGSAVGDNGSGYARALVSGDPFRGFSLEEVDNSSGGTGALPVHVITKGYVKLAIGSLAITDVGKVVYATDDNTFTLTPGTSVIGVVDQFISTGVGVVRFEAPTIPLGYTIVKAGTFTTLGGDAAESITVAGAVSTDIALVTLKTAGSTPRTILAAAVGTGAIAVTMSGDPSTDHVLSYVVLRATA